MSDEPDPRQHPMWKRWYATYERHTFGAAGQARLGAEIRGGVCHCPACRAVRAAINPPDERGASGQRKK